MNLLHRMLLQVILFVYILSAYVIYASVINLRESTVVSSNLDSVMRNDDVCLTPGCVKAATDILANMDDKMDPCDNFYQFACGGYIDRRVIKDDSFKVSTGSDVVDEVESKVNVLMNRRLNGSEPEFITMMKQMYDTCMNSESIENSGSEPLKKILNSLGGWPVALGDQWDESAFDWMETLFTMRKLGYSCYVLMDLVITADSRNNTVQIIKLGQTSLGMDDRSYYIEGLSDSTTAAYFSLMIKSANKLGANELTSEEELMEALKFETTLAEYSLPREEQRNASSLYHKYTVKQLQELVPQIDWLKYFNGLLVEPISEDEALIVEVPDFVKKLGELIVNTDKRIIANYMIWRVVMDSLDILSKDWRDLKQEYSSVVTGEIQAKPRMEECIEALWYRFFIALNSYYVRNYFMEDSKQSALEMVNYILKAFLTILDNTDWMDETTKAQAKEKANAITPFIGYPQELLNDSLIMEHYKNLVITNESYFNNVLSVGKWLADLVLTKKKSKQENWMYHSGAAIVNAVYQPLYNSIDFPAAILQDPFFNKDKPNYMNFGAIGVFIGHEITHGFDDQGRQYDKDGNNKNWWDGTTDELFKEKAKCIIYQYGNYTENGQQLDGVNTQGENIADNGGVREAYLAYQSWVQDNGPEKKLPGLKYTPNQLFFISTANVFCGKYRPEYLKWLITSGEHSPSQFRVNGPMSNLPEFAKEFQCSPGAPMNPENKCRVW